MTGPSQGEKGGRRSFSAADGVDWEVKVISHGTTSGYLNPKVHRPILEFRCVDRRRPRRYAALPAPHTDLAELSPSELIELLRRARIH